MGTGQLEFPDMPGSTCLGKRNRNTMINSSCDVNDIAQAHSDAHIRRATRKEDCEDVRSNGMGLASIHVT